MRFCFWEKKKSTDFTTKQKKRIRRRNKKCWTWVSFGFKDLATLFANIVNGATQEFSTTAPTCSWRSSTRRPHRKKPSCLRNALHRQSNNCLSSSLRKIEPLIRTGTPSCTDTFRLKFASTTKTQVKSHACILTCSTPLWWTYLPERLQRWAPWTRSRTTPTYQGGRKTTKFINKCLLSRASKLPSLFTTHSTQYSWMNSQDRELSITCPRLLLPWT